MGLAKIKIELEWNENLFTIFGVYHLYACRKEWIIFLRQVSSKYESGICWQVMIRSSIRLNRYFCFWNSLYWATNRIISNVQVKLIIKMRLDYFRKEILLWKCTFFVVIVALSLFIVIFVLSLFIVIFLLSFFIVIVALSFFTYEIIITFCL